MSRNANSCGNPRSRLTNRIEDTNSRLSNQAFGFNREFLGGIAWVSAFLELQLAIQMDVWNPSKTTRACQKPSS